VIVYFVPSCVNPKVTKLVLFKWTPDSMPPKSKFVYPNAVVGLVNQWNIQKHIDANDLSAFDYESLCKELKMDK
jgi:hypothetical protein